ncbi:7,8-didemethyl-8-hydroxy-5-deazariboflavin synthase CofG [Planctomonas sp. JC2975]|uniref:7,8-didemethyl-8-hydroxy-5-deazariboflavin synthase CofG n=1 Tax=Planctomonas sp. JC2975 TaxID=2729626 RepID=UPI003211D922
MPAELLPAPEIRSATRPSVPEDPRPTADAIASALTRALVAADSGIPPEMDDAETLLYARDAQLDELLDLAGRLRDAGLDTAGRPGVVTYSRKVFIPLTHLCQDRCHYCIFVQTPGKLAKAGIAPLLSEEEVLEIARQGAAMGCKEALFTLGDRPENRWAVAREWLADHGYASTIEYMRAMAIRVLEETGLLPHLNPGVMSWAELQRLKPVAPSMGMMLETTSVRLWAEKGQAHFGSPDKDPAVRLRVIDDAGRSQIPFTTGVLLGIGETVRDRVDAMFALRAASERWEHVQEVIVQNFRAKDATAMMHHPDLAADEYAAAVAVTRLVLGADARIQAPPNLTDHDELALLLRAGIDDWGGVSPLTPDHVNPERPWPQIDELARLTARAGYRLHERLTTHPHFVRRGEPWIDPAVLPHTRALADAAGLADEAAPVVGRPWTLQTPAAAPAAHHHATANDASVPTRDSAGSFRTLLEAARRDPSGLDDTDYIALLDADGAELESLAALADDIRRERVGDEITYVVNRNIDASLFRTADGLREEQRARSGGETGTVERGNGHPREEERAPSAEGLVLTAEVVSALADEAARLGATEVCVQGRIDARMPASAYADLVRAIHLNQPQVHVHAYRPIELLDGAARSDMPLAAYLASLRNAGVGTVPGTGARILDDRIRDILSGGTELPVAEWIVTIEAAHRAGLRSTATMVYGHIETAADQVAHLRTLSAVQGRTGGFTEFIAMPFVPQDSPVAVPGARPGPDLRESRAVHAVARLMLAGTIDHVQAAWTKLGFRGTRLVLAGGVDDLGGVLIDGELAPWAGPEQGRVLSVTDMRRIADEVGRPLAQRTTTYEPVGR